MEPDPNECGGDPHQGAATPDVITARTPAEADALPCPGTAHNTTADHSIATNVLWPLTVILGNIARRVERHRAAERSLTTPETRREAGSDPEPRGEVA